jgi:hypothetical protein
VNQQLKRKRNSGVRWRVLLGDWSNPNMDKEYLKVAARSVEAKLPDNHGFILMVAPFGDGPDNRMTYISSMRREDAINILKEWLLKAGAAEDWMKHIK